MTSQNINQTFEQEPQPVIKRPKIKKHLTKPMSRRQRKRVLKKEFKHERAYDRRQNKLASPGVKKPVLIGIGLTLILIIFFRYGLQIDFSVILEHFMPLSYGITLILMGLSIVVLFKDQTGIKVISDPITDFFIIKKGRVMGSTLRRHYNRINTRFMMVTLLKLYQKEQIAIVDERIIYGAMDVDLTKDEVALLNFMLDHGIRTIDDFIEAMMEEGQKEKKKDQLYTVYKAAIIEMADDKHYVNRSINKAKFILRTGAVFYGLLVLMLLAKGQGTLLMLVVFGLQALALAISARVTYANSRGAHERIRQLKHERRLLISEKASLNTALIYNYLFGREQRVLRRIQKNYKMGKMPEKAYQRFSETYNGFNYMLAVLRREQ